MTGVHSAAIAGSLPRWTLLLAAALGVLAGILGMHVVAGASLDPAHGGMASSARASHVVHGDDLLPAAVAAHRTSHGPAELQADCNYPPAGHGADAAHHGDCSPTFCQPAPSVPLP